MEERVDARTANLVCGVRKEMASISWKEPFVTLEISAEPARTINGKLFAVALPI